MNKPPTKHATSKVKTPYVSWFYFWVSKVNICSL